MVPYHAHHGYSTALLYYTTGNGTTYRTVYRNTYPWLTRLIWMMRKFFPRIRPSRDPVTEPTLAPMWGKVLIIMKKVYSSISTPYRTNRGAVTGKHLPFFITECLKQNLLTSSKRSLLALEKRSTMPKCCQSQWVNPEIFIPDPDSTLKLGQVKKRQNTAAAIVGDPDLDVFVPPGSGSISHSTDSDPDPLAGNTDPRMRIRICTKISRIPNTGGSNSFLKKRHHMCSVSSTGNQPSIRFDNV